MTFTSFQLHYNKSFLLFILVGALSFIATARELVSYSVGDSIPVECRDLDGSWTVAPTCIETSQPFSLKFGMEKFFQCSFQDKRDAFFSFMTDVIEGKKAWTCRVPVSADRQLYLHFNIPLWGIVEAPHVHVDNHVALIFHAESGRIIGGGMYPIRDKYKEVSKGGKLSFHGPVKYADNVMLKVSLWFEKSSFSTMGSALSEEVQTPKGNIVISVAMMVASLCTFIFAALYV